MQQQNQTAPRGIGWRHPLWSGFLVAASVGFSLGFACATPLAAFAAAAACGRRRGDAFRLVGAVWLASQLVGYGILGYPWTANSLAWGAVLGVAALAACEGAGRVAGRAGVAWIAWPAAFLAAFAAFEVTLGLAAVTLLGGTAGFAPAVVARIFAINLGAFFGLFLLDRLGATLGMVVRPAPRPA